MNYLRILGRLFKNRRKLFKRKNLRNLIDRTVYHIGLSGRLKSTTPIFIYQMGKVASLSVYKSLQGQYKGLVFHAHSFGSDHLHYGIRRLYRHFKSNHPIKIISLYREPIGRNISAFFENFEMYTGRPYQADIYSVKKLRQEFLENYKHDIPLNWFDNNINKYFGIDVYESEPNNKGFFLFEKNQVNLLLMRHDLDDQIKEKLISEFIGIKEFTLNNYNIGGDKVYAQTYIDFKKRVKLPGEYLLKMASSKYFKHFYSEEEISFFVDKWRETS